MIFDQYEIIVKKRINELHEIAARLSKDFESISAEDLHELHDKCISVGLVLSVGHSFGDRLPSIANEIINSDELIKKMSTIEKDELIGLFSKINSN